MSIEILRKKRNIPFAKVGMRVEVYNGNKGKITGDHHGDMLKIKLDGENHSGVYHPHWKIKYFDNKGVLIKEYKD